MMMKPLAITVALFVFGATGAEAETAKAPTKPPHCWLISYHWLVNNPNGTIAAEGFGSFEAIKHTQSRDGLLSYQELLDRIRAAKESTGNPGSLMPIAVSPIGCSPLPPSITQ